MANVGDTRTVLYEQVCPNDAVVTCSKQQECKRGIFSTIFSLGGLLFDNTYWEDVLGTEICEPCPTGSIPVTSKVQFCCFKGAFAKVFVRATGPGPVAYIPLPEHITNSPTVAVPLIAAVPNQCQSLTSAEASEWVVAMEGALEMMKATGVYANMIPNQEEAIRCLRLKLRSTGWPAP